MSSIPRCQSTCDGPRDVDADKPQSDFFDRIGHDLTQAGNQKMNDADVTLFSPDFGTRMILNRFEWVECFP